MRDAGRRRGSGTSATGEATGCARLWRFFFSSRRRHTRWTGDWSQTCALPIYHTGVASIHDCIVSGETRVVLATYCPSLRVHTRRREAALEPAPSDALGIQQVSHVFTGHSDLVDALKLGI